MIELDLGAEIDRIDRRRGKILAEQDKLAAERENRERERWRSPWLQLAVSTVLAAAVAAIVSLWF